MKPRDTPEDDMGTPSATATATATATAPRDDIDRPESLDGVASAAQRPDQRALLDLMGTLDWDPDVDYKSLR